MVASVFVASLLTGASSYAAGWEQIKALPATQCVFVAKNGNLIASDFLYTDYSGGIYYSEDKGVTWNKADVADYCYATMIQAGDYIIASGEGCHLARSKDNGVTWELLSYAHMFSDYISEDDIMYDIAYGITYYDNKLFVADFCGGGVIYSEDFGDTWTLTDRESLKYDANSGKSRGKEDGMMLDSYYNLSESNGRLLLFGIYFVYRLNDDGYTWELLRSDSNFMGVSATVDGKLVCGRAIMNYTDEVPFLEWTADGGDTWDEVARPTGVIDNNVRAMHSDAAGLYVGLQNGGIYYTNNFGDEWMDISSGLPYTVNSDDDSKVYESPLVIASDDEYVYMAVYKDTFSQSDVSGVYRFAKSELPTASIENVEVAVDAPVEYYDLGGRKVAQPKGGIFIKKQGENVSKIML